MKITDEMVTRARTVLAAQGPVPSDAVIKRALLAALTVAPAVRGRQGKKRDPRPPRVSLNVGRAEQEAQRNRARIEAGETFAGHKPSDFRR